MTMKRFAKAITCMAALLLAFACLTPAYADEAPTWHYVGKMVTHEDLANLKWWYGDKADVSYTASSLFMEIMHCSEDGGFEYSFAETFEWSDLPASIAVGDEGSLAIDGTVSLSKIQYSDHYLKYLYEQDPSYSPVAGLDVRLDIGYFDPHENREAALELGKYAERTGQTVFPNYLNLGSVHLENTLATEHTEHSVLLRSWENASEPFRVSAHDTAAAAADGEWRYPSRIAQGDYRIGETDREAEAYVLTLTMEDIGAGYKAEYYYEFLPNGESSAATGGDTPAEASGNGNAVTLSLVMFMIFALCVVLAFGVPAMRKRKKQ